MIISALKQNKKFLILLIVALEAVVILPTLFGFLKTPDGYYYNGIHNLTPGDFHLYLSYFEQARQGSLFFKDLYTGEEQTPSLFNPFFLFFGLIGKIFKLSNITALLIAKIVIIPVFISVLFSFFRHIFEKKLPLYLAMLFALFSSGLGVFIAPFISSYATSGGYIHRPMDLWLPEFNIFLTIYHNPLYAAALTLILLTFIFFIKAINENKIKWSIVSGFCALALFSIHPYHIPTIYGIPAIFIAALMIVKRRIIFAHLKHWGVLFLISAPSMLYQVVLVFTDFIMYGRYNGTGGPPTFLWLTILSYGLLFFLAIPSFLGFSKKFILQNPNNEKNKTDIWLLFAALWFIGGLLAVYFPLLNHTRRLTLGLQIPLVIFSIMTLLNAKKTLWYKKIENIANVIFFLPLFFIFFLGASTLNAVYADINLYKNLRAEIYIPLEIYNGINWLKGNTEKEIVVLTDLFHGNIIPGIAGQTVYIGHNSETISYDIKEKLLNWFFSENHAEERERKFLKDRGITHIFYTENLKKSGGWRPENKTYLLKVFENGKAAIYKVR
ncbi:MAG: hypothetical protein US76_01060 [Parcubacteria group bacterium GW2011_GWA2_38_13b]|nr:MAG: hypothetical protein US76_01060 [Parcubacteria group bacterium GW2011_GWA2_38_13b]